MIKTVRALLGATMLLTAAGFVQAAEVSGALLDVACSADTLKDGYKGALAHTKDCALMEACKKSGYGVVTEDGKFLKLDQQGNEKAVALLQKTEKADNIKVK